MYKSFSASLFITSFITLSYSFSSLILIVMLFIKLATLPVLIKSYMILFIIIWNVVGELIMLRSITVGLNDSYEVVNTTFCSLYYKLKSLEWDR